MSRSNDALRHAANGLVEASAERNGAFGRSVPSARRDQREVLDGLATRGVLSSSCTLFFIDVQ